LNIFLFTSPVHFGRVVVYLHPSFQPEVSILISQATELREEFVHRIFAQ